MVLFLVFLLHGYRYLGNLNPNHDRRTHRIFIGVAAFGLRQRPEHLEESTDLLVFGDGLLVNSMESIMDSQDLIQNWGLVWQKGIGDFQTTTEPVFGIQHLRRVATLLAFLQESSFS